MIKDKTSGARHDLTVTPVRFGTLGLGYYLSTLISTMIITAAALFACLLYLGAAGWYLSLSDVLLMVLDVFLLTMFGTALSSCINFFLSTDGQASAVGTIVSAGYGFICGAYMPISNFGTGASKSAFVFARNIRNESFEKSRNARSFCGNGRQRLPA